MSDDGNKLVAIVKVVGKRRGAEVENEKPTATTRPTAEPPSET